MSGHTENKTEQKVEPISPDTHKTNEVDNSCVNLECDHVEFNIYFDGTWNSKENSDLYNNADRDLKDRNDPKYNPEARFLVFDVSESISFARAPTGVDQLHRATKMSDPHIIALYVDGAGTETPEIGPDGKTKIYTGDNMYGAGTGWGSTGVFEKLRTMLKQVQTALQNYAQEGNKLPTIITFNVYGFSRGAATARMFCNRIIKQKNNLREVLQYVNLQQFDVRLKFVGLFDTVSSIGFNHTNDVKANDQGLDFEKNQVKKIVHIVAMHEYRQKFNVTNIAVPVQRGYGLEFAIPGCHTDIGDGLGTKGSVVQKKVNDKTGKISKKDVWYVNARDDQTQVILQRKIKFDPDSDKIISSWNPIPVSNAESKAKQGNNYADFTIVRENLIREGWVLDNEIYEYADEKYEQLVINREQISVDYPKIPTYLMIELIKQNQAYFLLEDKLKLYSISNSENSEELQKIYDNLLPQVKGLATAKEKYALTGNLSNGNLIKQPRIDIIGDNKLKNSLYNRYLHWGSAMAQEGFSAMMPVNIAQIDNKTNLFYRTIVSG